MLYLGCDPGTNGGIAVLDDGGAVRHLYALTGESARDLVDALWGVMMPARAVLEHVWTTGYKHAGDFKLGQSFGRLEAGLAASSIPFELVLPKKWQKEFGIAYPAGASSSAKKIITKATAQRLFPGVAITHATADALLLAEYCRRFHRRIGHGEKEDRSRSHQAEASGQARQETAAPARVAGRAPRDGAGAAPQARRPLHVDR